MADPIKSSVVHADVHKSPAKQFALPTYQGIIPFLIFIYFLIKTFIYIKDPKRHGK
jgi:hypothetical protein